MDEAVLEKLRKIGAKGAEDCGTELLHVEFAGSGRRRILRYYIDKEEGVNTDDCSRVSNIISTYLEVEDPIDGRYHLEVSSPGVDRPLFCEEDYGRFASKKARLILRKPHGGRKQLMGILLGITDHIVRFDDEKAGTLEIAYGDISRGNLIAEIDFK
ncbi:ribosome maturation factor RimP [Acidobacteriota bacterium]